MKTGLEEEESAIKINRRARETSEERRTRVVKLCLYYSLSSLVTSCILNGIGLPLNITVYTK